MMNLVNYVYQNLIHKGMFISVITPIEKASKRPVSEGGKESSCPGDAEPPKKCGRKSSYSEHSCGDFIVWLLTGSNELYNFLSCLQNLFEE